jgi:hypothetical protein
VLMRRIGVGVEIGQGLILGDPAAKHLVCERSCPASL